MIDMDKNEIKKSMEINTDGRPPFFRCCSNSATIHRLTVCPSSVRACLWIFTWNCTGPNLSSTFAFLERLNMRWFSLLGITIKVNLIAKVIVRGCDKIDYELNKDLIRIIKRKTLANDDFRFRISQ